MRTANPDLPCARNLRFKDYLLENVYLRATEAQRAEVMALWHNERAGRNSREAKRRSHQVVFLVRAGSGELAGVCTVGLVRVEDGRMFYAYRMFLRKRDRVPYLMAAVTVATRDFLRNFEHPEVQPAGMLIVAGNPKLMRPGVQKLFARHGLRFWGKTPWDEDVWAQEFDERET